jgi:hypothetical protein
MPKVSGFMADPERSEDLAFGAVLALVCLKNR